MIKLELLVILPPRLGFPARHRRSGVVLWEVATECNAVDGEVDLVTHYISFDLLDS